MSEDENMSSLKAWVRIYGQTRRIKELDVMPLILLTLIQSINIKGTNLETEDIVHHL